MHQIPPITVSFFYVSCYMDVDIFIHIDAQSSNHVSSDVILEQCKILLIQCRTKIESDNLVTENNFPHLMNSVRQRFGRDCSHNSKISGSTFSYSSRMTGRELEQCTGYQGYLVPSEDRMNWIISHRYQWVSRYSGRPNALHVGPFGQWLRLVLTNSNL